MRALFANRGFAPYLVAMFLNAFVDLGHKIVIQNTVFKTFEGASQSALIALVNALILLPFILMFTPASFVSNKYRKVSVMRAAAWFAVAITGLLTACYAAGWFWAAFALTIILAVQSAFFSPAKYGFIRECAGDTQLAAGNGVVQALTTVAILAGMLGFSVWYEIRFAELADTSSPNNILAGMVPLGFGLIALSLLEVWAAYLIPQQAQAGDPNARFDTKHYFTAGYLKDNLKLVFESRIIWLSIVGLSVYWGLAQSLIAVFPAFVQERLAINNTAVIQAMLAATGLGVMAGSLLAGRASRSHIETGLIPIGAVGLALGIALLASVQAIGLLTALMFGIGVAGGLFIVPLNALIQHQAPSEKMGTVLAGNNWVQNITMLCFLLLTAGASWAGLHAVWLFALLTVVALVGAAYTVSQLPHSFVRLIFGALFRRTYRIDVLGFEHIPKHGGALLLGNHISWIDWAIVQIACPRPIRFVIQREFYNLWFLKPFLKAFGAIPIAAGSSRTALAQVRQLIADGEVVCLFPEGAISRNGQLGQFHAGYQRAVEGLTGAVIVPFYLQGLWGSRLSRASGKLLQNRKQGMRRPLLVCFGKPLPLTTPPRELKQRVFELSIGGWAAQTDWLKPLPQTWLRTARKQLLQYSLIDSSGLKYRNIELIATVLAFSKQIRRQCKGSQNIGVLLPTSSNGLIANLAISLAGKTFVNLNYTMPPAALVHCIDATQMKYVVTSRLFIEKLAQRGLTLEENFTGIQPIFVEDLHENVSHWHRAASLLPADVIYSLFTRGLRRRCKHIDQPAAILFSSGSEGSPKGIMLSHRNIVANCLQIGSTFNVNDQDIMLASLPIFHSYGITVACLQPLLEGVPLVCHPDPTDVVNIAKACARYKATIMCNTAVVIQLFSRNNKVHPLMLASLRMVLSAAEKLQDDARRAFTLKFNKEIFEAYGATETTPLVTTNTPDYLDDHFWHVQVSNRVGSVGLPLPGTAIRIVDPETLASLPVGEDGLVLIGGTQVMLGYLNQPEKTQEVIVEMDGHRWYKSGDKGHLDADGFLFIVDRYSRFAKIAGEMVSLSACENDIKQALINQGIDSMQGEFVAVKLPHARKGEQIVMLYTQDLTEDELNRACRGQIAALMLPARWLKVDAIPKLGSGKLDGVNATKLAADLLAQEQRGDN